MKFDRTFAHRNDDSYGVATASRRVADEPTGGMPRVIDHGRGRGRGGIARASVAIRDRGDHAPGFAMLGTTRT